MNGVLDQAVDELGDGRRASCARSRTGCGRAASTTGSAPALRRLATHACRCPSSSTSAAEPLPDDIATTAYYVASEAVSNAVKHADADGIAVRVARDATAGCRSQVRDDGRGGAAPRPGSGLAGLTDRVAAAGGRAAGAQRAGRAGRVVEAVLPCAS